MTIIHYGTTVDYLAEKGHRLDSGHGKCIYCLAYAIDLYEDAAYGEVRSCCGENGDFGKGDAE